MHESCDCICVNTMIVTATCAQDHFAHRTLRCAGKCHFDHCQQCANASLALNVMK